MRPQMIPTGLAAMVCSSILILKATKYLIFDTGAPECYRSDDYLEQANIRIKPDVDIWSLGAIFSEAAVWIAHGYDGLLEYRTCRKDETDRLMSFKDGDCFHDGERVLRAVGKWHRDILGILRKNDQITTPVLRMIEDEMLVESDARSTAKQLWHRSQQILERAKQDTESSNDLTGNGTNPKGTSPRQPPEMPPSTYPPPRIPDTRRISGKHDQRQVSWGEGVNLYDVSRRDPSPDGASELGNEGSSQNDRQSPSGGTRNWRFPTRDSQHEFPGRRPTSNSFGSSGQHNNVSYHQKQPSEQSRATLRHRSSLHSSSDGFDYVGWQGGPETSSPREGVFQNKERSEEEPSPSRSRSRRDHPVQPEIRQSLPQLAEGSGDSYTSGDRTSSMMPNRTDYTSRDNSAAIPSTRANTTHHQIKQEIPFLSVGHASHWRTQHQSRKGLGARLRRDTIPERLPHQYLQERLKQRDHVCTYSVPYFSTS